MKVLMGAANLLSSPGLHPRAILVECSALNQSAYGYGPSDIISFMKQYEYLPFSVTENGPRPGWPRSNCGDDVLFLSKRHYNVH